MWNMRDELNMIGCDCSIYSQELQECRISIKFDSFWQKPRLSLTLSHFAIKRWYWAFLRFIEWSFLLYEISEKIETHNF